MFFRCSFRRKGIQIGNGVVCRRDDPDIPERDVSRDAHIRRSDPDRCRALRDLVKEFMAFEARSGRRRELRPTADLFIRGIQTRQTVFEPLAKADAVRFACCSE